MIVKVIGTGADPGGLVRYMFGRGTGEDRDLHENQRTVAGTTLAVTDPTREAVAQVADDLRLYARMWDVDPKVEHIQHIVISLNPTDRPVTDAEWRTITEDYLAARGITDPGKAPVRWVAVNHGRNAAGADHVHLAVSLVRADGTRVDTWQERKRSQRWAQGAEARYRLAPLESRAAGTGAKALTRDELAKAKADGREPLRLRLADQVRPIAAASTSELDYVQRLRAAGLDPKPRITAGKVTGYSIGAEGQRFGGGTIAPELRLPALRRVQWDDRNGEAAAQEWARPTPHRPAAEHPGALRAALDVIERDLWRAPLMTPAEHRAWSAQAAGLSAAAAAATPDPADRAALQALSRDLGRWAGPTPARPPQPVRRAAQLVAAALGGSPAGDRTSPDDGALADTAGSIAQIAQIAQMHRATRPAVAQAAVVEQRAQAQQAAVARANLAPGYYRTEQGVIRVKRARAGHVYAATRDPDTGQWRPGKAANLTAAAAGQRMTPTQVAAWETTTRATPAPTAVPVQPVAPRTAPRRQPTIRRWR